MADQSKVSHELDDILNGMGVPEGMTASGAEKTAAFDGMEAAAPAPRAGRSSDPEAASKRSLLRNLLASNAIQTESIQGKIRMAFSEAARVCGYTTATNDKFDFAKKKDKVDGVEAYTLFVKMTPPSKVDGILVRYPVDCWNELNRSSADSMQLSAAQNPNQSFTLTIVEAGNMINWMQRNTAGYLLEDEALFEPVIRKAGKNVMIVQTPADVQPSKKGNGVPAKPAIYVDVAGNLKANSKGTFTRPKLRLKSNYRTKLVTPGNYIAKRKFEVMPVKTSYTPDEISHYIDMYFNRYLSRTTKAGKTIRSVFSQLSAAGRTYFHASEDANGKWQLDATEYFTGDASASAWNTITVPHWFLKDDHGEPIQIPGTQVQLAVREQESADKPIGFRKVMIQDPAKAQPGAYVLDLNGEHKKIGEACKGMLTFEVLDKFYSETASSGRKGAGAGLGSGINIMGLTEDALESLVSNFMK